MRTYPPIPLFLTGFYCYSPHPSQERSITHIYPSHWGIRVEQGNDHGVNAITKIPPSYDLIIEENGLFKTIEVWAANKEGAVSEWRGNKGEIRGVVFNEKNYKDESGLNLL